MQLEMPTDVVCPLCMDETVELRENKSERPFFSCSTFQCAVNLRPGGNDRAEAILETCAKAESSDELETTIVSDVADDEPDDDPDVDESDETDVESPDDGETLADLLGGDDE